jgi:hypothetical protein
VELRVAERSSGPFMNMSPAALPGFFVVIVVVFGTVGLFGFSGVVGLAGIALVSLPDRPMLRSARPRSS